MDRRDLRVQDGKLSALKGLLELLRSSMDAKKTPRTRLDLLEDLRLVAVQYKATR